jgi:hypothetical protein
MTALVLAPFEVEPMMAAEVGYYCACDRSVLNAYQRPCSCASHSDTARRCIHHTDVFRYHPFTRSLLVRERSATPVPLLYATILHQESRLTGL